MQPEARDPAYLWDMLEAARRAARFISGLSREAYLANEMAQAAVERALEVLGEAARRVSDGFRQAHPEIPWQSLISQRNIIIHRYEEVDHNLVWQSVATELDALTAALQLLIPPLPPEVS
jgi:uncharacterized protein with HEPN domain